MATDICVVSLCKILKTVAIFIICGHNLCHFFSVSILFQLYFITSKIIVLCFLVLKNLPGSFEVLICVKKFKTRVNTQWSITMRAVETCLFAQPRSYRPTHFTVRFILRMFIPLHEMSFF